MFFVTNGALMYSEGFAGALRTSADDSHIITTNEHVSELSLWVEWVHCGDFHASTHSQLVILDADRFMSICMAHNSILGSSRRYAQALIAEVAKVGHRLTDLKLETVDVTSLVNDCFDPEPDRDPEGPASPMGPTGSGRTMTASASTIFRGEAYDAIMSKAAPWRQWRGPFSRRKNDKGDNEPSTESP